LRAQVEVTDARKRSALKQWGNSSSWAGERGGLTELYGCAAPRIKFQFVLVGSLLPVLWLPYLLLDSAPDPGIAVFDLPMLCQLSSEIIRVPFTLFSEASHVPPAHWPIQLG